MKYLLLLSLLFISVSANINFDPLKAVYFSNNQNPPINKEEYNQLYNNVIQIVRNAKIANSKIDEFKLGLQLFIYLARINTPTSEQLIYDLIDEKTSFEMDIKIQ